MKYFLSLLLLLAGSVGAQDFPFFAASAQANDPTIYEYVRYDAQALGSNVSDVVSVFADQGIFKYHATASGTARPYYTNNVSEINGQGYLRFDGTSDTMGTNVTASRLQPFHMFFVASLDDTSGGDKVYLEDSIGTNYSLFSNGGRLIYGTGAYVSKTNNDSAWVIYELCMNGTRSYMRTNNSFVGITSATTNGCYGINFSKSGKYAAMKVAFLSVYTNEISLTKGTEIVSTLSSRFGITVATRQDIPSWNPTTNASLLSVYDASTIIMPVQIAGQISRFSDGGPKAYHLNAIGSDVYVSSRADEWNGEVKVTPNGSGFTSYLQTNFTTTFPQPTTVIAVMAGLVDGGGVKFYRDVGNTAGVLNQVAYVDSAIWCKLNAGTAAATRMGNMEPRAVYEFKYNGTDWGTRSNNVVMGTDGTATVGTQGLKGLTFAADQTGAYKTKLNFWWIGVYTNLLSATERSNIYYFLGNKYNLPVSFP